MSWRITGWKIAIPVLAILVAWACLAPFLAERLVVARPLDRADVILVLAGSGTYVERTRKAAIVYRNGVAPKVLLTNDGERAGWSPEIRQNPPFFELARRELVAHGVPDDAIEILPPAVSGTMMEATIVGRKAAERRWRSILIVTSAYHTRRALWTFEKVFSENGIATAIGIAPAETMPPALYWWLSEEGWRDVAGEYVKGVYYYFVY